MNTPDKRLRWAREKAGYASATEAAEARGWNASTYRTHENGQRNFSIDVAKTYAKAFGVQWLWLKEGGQLPGVRQSSPAAASSSIQTRGEVAAGQWLDLDAEQDYRNFEQYPIAPDPTYPAPAQYGLIVRGTSMNRVAAEGTVLHCLDLGIAGVEPINDDIVIVERRRADGQQKEVTAKRIRRDGDAIILAPDSTEPKWKPIRFNTTKPPEDVTVSVVALVIGLYQPLRGRRLPSNGSARG